MAVQTGSASGSGFLDMQARIGITKHVGGLQATDELLALCHVEDAHDVLNVGCGIGVGPAYIARKHGCRVVGTDISDAMIEWSQRRAREVRVQAQVELRTADVLDLPFESDRFDVVVCESVLVFVEDKSRAIAECVRVTRPGGYVGLNEGLWIKEPPAEMVERVKDALGPFIPDVETWRSLWEASGLQDRIMTVHPVDARTELRGRIQWIGWRWILRAWGRALRLYITDPSIRQAIKETFEVPTEVFQYAGYGLMVGRK